MFKTSPDPAQSSPSQGHNFYLAEVIFSVSGNHLQPSPGGPCLQMSRARAVTRDRRVNRFTRGRAGTCEHCEGGAGREPVSACCRITRAGRGNSPGPGMTRAHGELSQAATLDPAGPARDGKQILHSCENNGKRNGKIYLSQMLSVIASFIVMNNHLM